jgi:hypothetical protein
MTNIEHEIEGKIWWLEITTNEPHLYQFGPFESEEEGKQLSGMYLADLIGEGWEIITINTKQDFISPSTYLSDGVSAA